MPAASLCSAATSLACSSGWSSGSRTTLAERRRRQQRRPQQPQRLATARLQAPSAQVRGATTVLHASLLLCFVAVKHRAGQQQYALPQDVQCLADAMCVCRLVLTVCPPALCPPAGERPQPAVALAGTVQRATRRCSSASQQSGRRARAQQR